MSGEPKLYLSLQRAQYLDDAGLESAARAAYQGVVMDEYCSTKASAWLLYAAFEKAHGHSPFPEVNVVFEAALQSPSLTEEGKEEVVARFMDFLESTSATVDVCMKARSTYKKLITAGLSHGSGAMDSSKKRAAAFPSQAYSSNSNKAARIDSGSADAYRSGMTVPPVLPSMLATAGMQVPNYDYSAYYQTQQQPYYGQYPTAAAGQYQYPVAGAYGSAYGY